MIGEPQPCVSSPCANGATCNVIFDGVSVANNVHTCTCAVGFTGDLCEINIDECTSSPCGVGNTCLDGVAGFTCDCSPYATGALCEAEVHILGQPVMEQTVATFTPSSGSNTVTRCVKAQSSDASDILCTGTVTPSTNTVPFFARLSPGSVSNSAFEIFTPLLTTTGLTTNTVTGGPILVDAVGRAYVFFNTDLNFYSDNLGMDDDLALAVVNVTDGSVLITWQFGTPVDDAIYDAVYDDRGVDGFFLSHHFSIGSFDTDFFITHYEWNLIPGESDEPFVLVKTKELACPSGESSQCLGRQIFLSPDLSTVYVIGDARTIFDQTTAGTRQAFVVELDSDSFSVNSTTLSAVSPSLQTQGAVLADDTIYISVLHTATINQSSSYTFNVLSFNRNTRAFSTLLIPNLVSIGTNISAGGAGGLSYSPETQVLVVTQGAAQGGVAIYYANLTATEVALFENVSVPTINNTAIEAAGSPLATHDGYVMIGGRTLNAVGPQQAVFMARFALDDIVNSCASNPCPNNATCINTLSNYTCACAFPYTGANCTVCASGSKRVGSDCFACTAGSYQFEEDQTTCVLCDPGNYSGAGSAFCLPCGADSFQSQAGQSSCTACTSGSYAPLGSSDCTPCSTNCVTCATVNGAEECSTCMSGFNGTLCDNPIYESGETVGVQFASTLPAAGEFAACVTVDNDLICAGEIDSALSASTQYFGGKSDVMLVRMSQADTMDVTYAINVGAAGSFVEFAAAQSLSYNARDNSLLLVVVTDGGTFNGSAYAGGTTDLLLLKLDAATGDLVNLYRIPSVDDDTFHSSMLDRNGTTLYIGYTADAQDSTDKFVIAFDVEVWAVNNTLSLKDSFDEFIPNYILEDSSNGNVVIVGQAVHNFGTLFGTTPVDDDFGIMVLSPRALVISSFMVSQVDGPETILGADVTGSTVYFAVSTLIGIGNFSTTVNTYDLVGNSVSYGQVDSRLFVSNELASSFLISGSHYFNDEFPLLALSNWDENDFSMVEVHDGVPVTIGRLLTVNSTAGEMPTRIRSLLRTDGFVFVIGTYFDAVAATTRPVVFKYVPTEMNNTCADGCAFGGLCIGNHFDKACVCQPGNAGISSCAPCAAGTFSNAVGLTVCTNCPFDTYPTTVGQTTCTACDLGTRNFNPTTANCTNCPFPCGNCTAFDGGSCSSCIPGYSNPANSCSTSVCSSWPCQNFGVCSVTEAGAWTCSCRTNYDGDVCELYVGPECDSNPCTNSATCIPSEGLFQCVCPEGFTGDHCETDIDECYENPCLNGGSCVDGIAAFTCVCATPFTGEFCETEIPVDECSSSPCLNGGVCNDGTESFVCVCPTGIIGIFCETNIDECASFPCQNGATCVDAVDGFACSCVSGYNGTLCDVDIDECVSSPCQNGATCSDAISGYSCLCSAGYNGTLCDVNIDECASTPCLNGGICVDGVDGFACSCASGYNGTLCDVDIDECASSPCQNGATCNDAISGYSCLCSVGFNGTLCGVNIDECASFPCQNGATCVDAVDGFACSCVSGYNGTLCDVDIDECASSPCQNGATCSDAISGYSCLCSAGFNGTLCGVNIDECASTPCLNGGTCVDGVNGFSCTCQSGFTDANCATNIDECATHPCQQGGTCIDGLGSFVCTCATGFTGTVCETEIPFDECSSRPCLNGGVCNDGTESFVCVCPTGIIGIFCETNIDECSDVTCPGDTTCIDFVNGYQCSCLSSTASEAGEVVATVEETHAFSVYPGGLVVDSAWDGAVYVAYGVSGSLFGTYTANDVAVGRLTNATGGAYSWTRQISESNRGDDQVTMMVDGRHGRVFVLLEKPASATTFHGQTSLSVSKRDGALMCLNAETGATLYTVLLGTSEDDTVRGIALTRSGEDAYVVGYTSGNTTGNANAGGWDIFVARLAAADGNVVWYAQYGGASNDFGKDIVMGPTGDVVYLSGVIGSTTYAGAATGADTEIVLVVHGLNATNGASLTTTFSTPSADFEIYSVVMDGARRLLHMGGYTQAGFGGSTATLTTAMVWTVNVTSSETVAEAVFDDGTESQVNALVMLGDTLLVGGAMYGSGILSLGYVGGNRDGFLLEVDAMNTSAVVVARAMGATMEDDDVKLLAYNKRTSIASVMGSLGGQNPFLYSVCENKGECASSPCQNGATCRDGTNHFTCDCVVGYAGTLCSINIDECASFPCQNGATCVDAVDGFACSCASGYTGTQCDVDIDECASSPCQNGATCIDAISGYLCLCSAGYNGALCGVNIDECASTPCLNGGTCVDGVNEFSCTCQSGFTDANCATNIDDCATHPCQQGGTCIDGLGSFVCTCTTAFTGMVCETEIPFDECSSRPCLNGATCEDETNSYNCNCARGFEGDSCETNIDDCVSAPCANTGTCRDGIESYACLCPLGTLGVNCETDIDECASSPCTNGATCTDEINRFVCVCASGFTGRTCDVDIDECASAPCALGAQCTNNIDGFVCACPPNTLGKRCESDCRGGRVIGTHGSHKNRISAYVGCSTVAGDMVINADVTSLAGFSITFIDGSLYIENTTLLASLAGLESLTNVTGGIIISNNGQLLNLDGLSGLRGIGLSGNNRRRASTTDTLSITNNPLLTSLTGLSGLTGVTVTGALTVSGCDNLATLDGLQGVVAANSVVLEDNGALTNVSALSSCAVSSSVTLDNNGMTSFARLFESTTSLSGSLTIRNNANLVSLVGMEPLTSLGGTLTLSNNGFVTLDCTPLAALASVGGVVSITQHASMTTLSCSLPALTTVVGVNIDNNTALATLSGFDSVTTVGESGIKLVRLSALTQAKTCFGALMQASSVEVNDLAVLTDVEDLFLSTQLHAGMVVNGTLTIKLCPKLDDVHFNNVTTLHGSIALVNLANLRHLRGFHLLETVTGNVTLQENANLVTIRGMQSLHTISGYAVIVDNIRLCAGRYVDWQTVSSGRAILNGNPSLSSAACILRILSETPTNSTQTAQDNAERLKQVTVDNSWLAVENVSSAADIILGSLDGVIKFSDNNIDDVSTNTTNSTLDALNNLVDNASTTTLRSDQNKVNQVPVLMENFADLITRLQACDRFSQLSATQLVFLIEKASNATQIEKTYDASNGATATLQPGFALEIFGADVNSLSCFDTKFIEYIGVNPFGPVLDNQTQRIDSNIVGLTVSNRTVSGLTNATAVLLTFKHLVPVDHPRECVYFDFDTLLWSSDGCEVISQSATETTCRCYHLTSFAVLAGVDLTTLSAADQKALTILTYIGCSLSIIACLYILLSFVLIAAIRTRPQTNLANLCVAILAVNITFLAGIDQVSDRNGCHAVAVVLYFFVMVTFAWTANIAHEYWVLLVRLSASPPQMRVYAFTGWVIPAIITLIVTIVDVSNSWEPVGLGSGSSHCWLSSRSGLIGAVLVPIGLVLLHNLFVMIRVMHTLRNSRKKIQSTESRSNWRNILLYCGLFVSMGLAWLFAYIALVGGVVFWYLFIIFNTTQGFLICLLFSLRGKAYKEVKTYVKNSLPGLSRTSQPSRTESTPNKTSKQTQSMAGPSSSSGDTTNNSASTNTNGNRKYSEGEGTQSCYTDDEDTPVLSVMSEVHYTTMGDMVELEADAQEEAIEGQMVDEAVEIGNMIANPMNMMPDEGNDDDEDEESPGGEGGRKGVFKDHEYHLQGGGGDDPAIASVMQETVPVDVVVAMSSDDYVMQRKKSIANIGAGSAATIRANLLQEVEKVRDDQSKMQRDIDVNETIEQRKERLRQFVERRDALILQYRKITTMLGARAQFDADGLPMMDTVDEAFDAIEPGIVGRLRKELDVSTSSALV